MILSGLEIEKRLGTSIKIEPWDRKCLNPNSYNIHLDKTLMVYERVYDSGRHWGREHLSLPLDMRKDNPLKTIEIPEDGLVLMPGILYLGRTVEYTETFGLVPMIEGRSSIGRLGMFIHVTAGFGDVGFRGYWTLEIMVTQPLKIYPGVAVGQLYYHTIQGEAVPYGEDGKYQGNSGIQGSQLWRDFK